jgi:upstream activation factor subunit UAF30
MSQEDILLAIDELLVHADVSNLSFKVMKTQLLTLFDSTLIESNKTMIKEYLMSKISESLQISLDVVPPLVVEELLLDTTPTTKKKRNGFQQLVQLAPVLESLLGESHLSRSEVVKKIWVYIKTNNLQDPIDKRFILCDEKLHAVFKKKRINMFKMQQPLALLMKNIHQLQDAKESDNDNEDDDSVGDSDEKSVVLESISKKRTRKSTQSTTSKSTKSGNHKGFGTVELSSVLAEVVGATSMPRTEVIKKLWEYIKANDLQKPEDKRVILCDDKLKAIFKQNQVQMFGMNKHLTKV